METSLSVPSIKNKDLHLNPSSSGNGMENIILKTIACSEFSYSEHVHSIIFIHFLVCVFELTGSKSQKVPVHKMVRTDSSDPAGRLHSYLYMKPQKHLETNSSLTAVRSDP